MKTKFLFILMFTLLGMTHSGIAGMDDGDVLLRVESFEESCTTGIPLGSKDRCNEKSRYGKQVMACAENLALGSCEAGLSLECRPIYTWAESEVSNPLGGYIKCTGSAVARGFVPVSR